MLLVISKQILIIIYFMVWTIVWTENYSCNDDISNTVSGYRCPDDFVKARLMHVTRKACILYCHGKVRCRMISFDKIEHTCLMYRELCVEMNQDIRFSSLLLHEDPEKDYVSWSVFSGSVPMDKRIIHTDAGKYSLVRIHYNDEILPARLRFTDVGDVKTVKHKDGLDKVNADAMSYPVEFLVVSETYSMAWVPYTAGMDMPLKAVKGGQKWNEEPLFVAALWTTAEGVTKYEFGYYDPQTELGYAFNKGVASNASVDLLVAN